MSVILKQKNRYHFLPIYKKYLVTKLKLNQSQVEEIFSDKEVMAAFNACLDEFYKNSDCGVKVNKDLYPVLKKYENLVAQKFGFEDNYFRYFLNIYRYYTSKTNNNLFSKYGTYLFKKEKEYFSMLSHVCCEIFDNVYVDLTNNNLWWEYENAASLRRQFLNDMIVIPIATIQELSVKYLGRELNIEKELRSDTRTSPPINLVNELDNKMAKLGYAVVYTWLEYSEQEKHNVIKNALSNPPKDRYYFKRYMTPQNINVKEK